jgi:SAM-dependent methyltransferase
MPQPDGDALSRWNERYSTEGFIFGVEPNRFVAEHLAGLSPRRVLDLGCGQGRNAVWLALQGHEVTALDLSDVAVSQARRLAEEAGVSPRLDVADLLDWDSEPDSADLVLLSYLQLPEPTRRTVHAKAVHALAPGGTVFLIAHHLDNVTEGVGGPPYPEVNYTEEDLAGDFADLEIARLEKVMREVDRPGVTGTAIDVMLIAHKAPGHTP